MNYQWNAQFALDLFGTGRTLVPVCIGGVILLSGWAVSAAPLVGVGLLLVGVGAALGAVRLVTDGEQIHLQQIKRKEAERHKKEEAELSRVALYVALDTDKRTRQALKALEALRRNVEDVLTNDPEIAAFISTQFRETFTDLFWKSVYRIERAHRLLDQSRAMTHKEGVLAVREKMIDEVEENVASLTRSFEGLATMAITQDEDGMDRLRSDLESRLEVAEAVNSELNGLGVRIENRDKREYLANEG